MGWIPEASISSREVEDGLLEHSSRCLLSDAGLGSPWDHGETRIGTKSETWTQSRPRSLQVARKAEMAGIAGGDRVGSGEACSAKEGRKEVKSWVGTW
jgi:hypothetical protein